MYGCQQVQTTAQANGCCTQVNTGNCCGCSQMMANTVNNGISPMNNGLTPIVMPGQVRTFETFSFVEQPVIFPVECRQVNRVIGVPRFYTAYTQTWCNG